MFNTNDVIAWTLLFNNKINHIAFQVDDIDECYHKVSQLLPEYSINKSIEVSEDKQYRRFNLNSEMIDYKFTDKTKSVPHSFIQFVERREDSSNNRSVLNEVAFKNATIYLN